MSFVILPLASPVLYLTILNIFFPCPCHLKLVSISASLFLKGPTAQCKSMFLETRIVATLVYLVLLILTLIASFIRVPLQGFVLILLVTLQFCAFVWYSLSYIPYGRSYVKKMCCNIGDEIV